uniref:Tuftelin-interacting protein 11 n=1 Tax=Hirondellea gigas TaxID=1518452 RepID=A0A2P2I9F2_9CRUS
MSSDEEEEDEGQWIAGQWQGQNRRRRKHQSKNEALYGIFGNYPEENDYLRPNHRSATMGIAFRSSGTMDMNDDKKADDDDDSDEKDFDVAPAKGSRPHSPLPERFGGRTMSDGDDDDDADPASVGHAGLGWSESNLRSNLPTSFSSSKGAPKKSAMKRKRDEEDDDELNPVSFHKDFARFEQHTRGIGMKLMKKMGFKGRLGKNETGRSEPVVAVPRRARAGLNFNGADQKVENDYRNDAEKMKSQRKQKRAQQERSAVEAGWRKTTKSKPKKVYLTAAELVQSKSKPKPKIEMIFDFTQNESGKAVNIADAVGSYSVDVDTTILPELQHNIGKIVETIELEILDVSTKLNRSKDSVVALENDRNTMAHRVQREADQISRTKELIAILDDLALRLGESYNPNYLPGDKITTPSSSSENSLQPNGITLEEIADIWENIQNKFREEYSQFGVSGMAVTMVFPRIKERLSHWKPLEDPSGAETLLTRWRYLLSANLEGAENTNDVYTELVEKIVVPKLRSSLMNDWDVKSTTSCVELFQSVQQYLPNGIVYRLLSTLVVPKITHSVSLWEPNQETIPIHEWIHPWLPLLAVELQPACDQVFRKLSGILHHWKFGDSSCHTILLPWIDVFTESQMRQLIKTRILPKLHMTMNAFIINPLEQDFEIMNSFSEWEDLIEENAFLILFEKRFFPKFHAVLHRWLSARDTNGTISANFNEIASWYEVWKTHFTDKLLNHRRFQEQLNISLDMMNCVILKHSLPTLKDVLETAKRNCAKIALKTGKSRRNTSVQFENPSIPKRPQSFDLDDDDGLSFRELVERFAQDHNVTFVPNTSLGRYHGKQIFQFGNYNVYLDNELIFMKKKGQDWKPTSLTELLV